MPAAQPNHPDLEHTSRVVQLARQRGHSLAKIARRLYTFERPRTLHHPENVERAFDLFLEVSENFGIPFQAVRAIGSGQLGYSPHKAREFVPKSSDLDLAIVDPHLFATWCHHCSVATRDYSDNASFKDPQTHRVFIDNLAKGFFRPDLMPFCSKRTQWFRFFSRLSQKFGDIYSNVNCGIYISEDLFELKLSHDVQKL